MESVIFVVYALVLAAVVALPTFFLSRTFVLRKKLMCPHRKQPVRVEFVCRGSYRNVIPLRVKSCSAFKPSRKVTCDRKCLSSVGRTAVGAFTK